jgi:hypothetical protein
MKYSTFTIFKITMPQTLLEYSRCQKKYTRLGLDAGQRGIIMLSGDKPFLFVLYICSAEGTLSYKNLSNI